MAKSSVSKNGNNYEVDGLKLSDPQVVAVLTAVEADGADLDDFVEKSIGIGVRALQATGVSLGVEALTDEITRARAEMTEASKKWQKELDDKVKAVAGEDGSLAKSIDELLETFSEELTDLTGGENSPIREGIKKQMADMAKKLLDDFSRKTTEQNTEIAKLLDPKDPKSPLREIVSKLEGLDVGLKGVKDQMVEKATKSAALEDTAASGAPYEDLVVNAVQKIASLASDVCTSTGNTTGLVKHSKKGDGVIELKQGDRNVARIVVEAKNRKLSMPDWQKEIAGAKENRDALAFVGFSKYIDDMPNGGRIMMIDRLTWLVAYDPEIDSPELLLVVYQMIKTNTLVAAGNLTEDKVSTINAILDGLFTEVKRLDRFATDIVGIRNTADRVQEELKAVSAKVTRDMRDIQQSMSPEVRALELEGDSTLEIEE